VLLLFDIDGTLLLRASVEHRAALHAAIREVHGVAIAPQPVPAAGRTDAAIAADIAALAGVPAERVAEAAGDVMAAACRHYERLCPDDLSGFVAPGVPAMLADVAADGSPYALALLTGNYEPIARCKLAAAGIGGWFPHGQGAFGSDHRDRDALPPLARMRAGKRSCGRLWPRERTVVIGDTPLDIACARADGVAVIGITTGPYGAADLVAADAVVEEASELPAALAALGAPDVRV